MKNLKRILVCDDDPNQLEFYSRILDQFDLTNGFKLFVDGKPLVEELKNSNYSDQETLIISDFYMPYKGLYVYQDAKELGFNKIIIRSSASKKSLQEKLKSQVEIMSKFDPDSDLIEKILEFDLY